MAEDVGGRREPESVQDLSLAAGRLHGMHDAAEARALFDERADTEGPNDAFGGQTLFRPRCIGRDGLAIQTLQEMVRGQGNLEQTDEGFDVGSLSFGQS